MVSPLALGPADRGTGRRGRLTTQSRSALTASVAAMALVRQVWLPIECAGKGRLPRASRMTIGYCGPRTRVSYGISAGPYCCASPVPFITDQSPRTDADAAGVLMTLTRPIRSCLSTS
jgi:hypothetical protein